MNETAKDLGDRWARVLAEAGPEPLSGKAEAKVRSLAAEAVDLVQSNVEDAGRARQLGAELFTLAPPVPAVTPALQEAWLTTAQNSLSTEQEVVKRPWLIRLGGELALGFWCAYLETTRATDAAVIQRLRHDLKTPLNSITGFSKVILRGLDGPITDLQREDLTIIFESGTCLLRMIDDVMGAMQRDAAQRQGACGVTDLAILLGDLVSTAQPLVERHGHQLHLELEGHLGALPVAYAQTRWALLDLVLAMGHLADHAIITLSAHRTPDDMGVLLAFSVQGAGVPSDTETLEAALRLGAPRQFCTGLGGTLRVDTGEPDAVRVEIRLPDTAVEPI